MRIVFMGTPDFSVPCLQRLIADGEEVVGVFTQPDKPKGRGYELTPPPVKVEALKHNIPVFQPKSMRDGEVLKILETLQPDLNVVVAYGRFCRRKFCIFRNTIPLIFTRLSYQNTEGRRRFNGSF